MKQGIKKYNLKKIKKTMIKKNRLILLLFQNRSIFGYLKIIAQLIIVVDLQINQCKCSINLLAFSLLTKVSLN